MSRHVEDCIPLVKLRRGLRTEGRGAPKAFNPETLGPHPGGPLALATWNIAS
jgi:hypothetical protein